MSDDEIRYLRAHDGIHLAYRVRGSGSIDVLEIGGFGTLFPVDAADDQPRWRRFEERLGRFARLVKFDMRGIGYSDPLTDPPTVDDWVSDALAVLDAVGSDRAALLASSFGGFAAIRLAAEHPDRVAALVLTNSGARFRRSDDYPIGVPDEIIRELATIATPGGSDTNDIDLMAPSLADDPEARRWWTRTARRGAGPATASAMWQLSVDADVRDSVPDISVPTLVIRTTSNAFVRPEHSAWLTEHLPDARLRDVAGADQVVWAIPGDAVVNEIEEFLTGARSPRTGTRALLAVLFTDIVESTSRNARSGDGAWLDLLARHDDLAGREIRRRDGRLVKRLGDGLLAVFTLASDAIDAGLAVTAAAEELDIGVRAGVHVAEVEEVDDDVLGLGVTIAARVLSEADGGEVLTTRAVADLLAGSAFEFDERGRHELKGVPGDWELSSVTRHATPHRPASPRRDQGDDDEGAVDDREDSSV